MNENTKEPEPEMQTVACDKLLAESSIASKYQQIPITDKSHKNVRTIREIFMVEIALIFACLLILTTSAFVHKINTKNATQSDNVYKTPSTRLMFTALNCVDFLIIGCFLLALCVFVLLVLIIDQELKPIKLIFVHRQFAMKFIGSNFIILLSASLICIVIISLVTALTETAYANDFMNGIRDRESTRDTDADVVQWLRDIQNKSMCCGSRDYDDYTMPPPSCCNKQHENLHHCLGKRAEKPVNVEVGYYDKGCLDIVKALFNDWFPHYLLPWAIVNSVVCSFSCLLLLILLSKRVKIEKRAATFELSKLMKIEKRAEIIELSKRVKIEKCAATFEVNEPDY